MEILWYVVEDKIKCSDEGRRFWLVSKLDLFDFVGVDERAEMAGCARGASTHETVEAPHRKSKHLTMRNRDVLISDPFGIILNKVQRVGSFVQLAVKYHPLNKSIIGSD